MFCFLFYFLTITTLIFYLIDNASLVYFKLSNRVCRKDNIFLLIFWVLDTYMLKNCAAAQVFEENFNTTFFLDFISSSTKIVTCGCMQRVWQWSEIWMHIFGGIWECHFQIFMVEVAHKYKKSPKEQYRAKNATSVKCRPFKWLIT